MDRNSLEGLAASIRNDGLLQNLVVRPVKGKGAVEIRTSLSKDDSLRIATVENLQRQNLMSPLASPDHGHRAGPVSGDRPLFMDQFGHRRRFLG
jgi:ParB-like chromosome segregation protein Spo0J